MNYSCDDDGVFEIREYLDDDGSVRDRTVIDISKELEFMRKIQQQHHVKEQEQQYIEAKDNNNDHSRELNVLLIQYLMQYLRLLMIHIKI